MALTLSVILTYWYVQIKSYFDENVNNDKDVTLLPANKALIVKLIDDNDSLDNAVTKRIKRPLAKNDWTIKGSETDCSCSKDNEKNALIIKPSDVNINHILKKKKKTIGIDSARKMSTWKSLKARRMFLRKHLRKSIVNLFVKALAHYRNIDNVMNSHEDLLRFEN